MRPTATKINKLMGRRKKIVTNRWGVAMPYLQSDYKAKIQHSITSTPEIAAEFKTYCRAKGGVIKVFATQALREFMEKYPITESNA